MLKYQRGFVAQTYLSRVIPQYISGMNKPASKIYPTTNRSSYNRTLINRGNLKIWFDPNTRWHSDPNGK